MQAWEVNYAGKDILEVIRGCNMHLEYTKLSKAYL